MSRGKPTPRPPPLGVKAACGTTGLTLPLLHLRPSTQNNNTPALLGKRWHPAHPRMYRSWPAAAAPLPLPIGNSSDEGRPRSTSKAGTHTQEPLSLAPAPRPPTHSSSATRASPLPPTVSLAPRRPCVPSITGSLTTRLSLLARAHPPLSPPSPVVVNPRTPATYALRIRNGSRRDSEGSGGSGGGGSGEGGLFETPVLQKEAFSLFSRGSQGLWGSPSHWWL